MPHHEAITSNKRVLLRERQYTGLVVLIGTTLLKQIESSCLLIINKVMLSYVVHDFTIVGCLHDEETCLGVISLAHLLLVNEWISFFRFQDAEEGILQLYHWFLRRLEQVA